MKTKLFALVVCLVGIAACNSKDANKGIEQFLSEKTVKVSIGGVKDLKHNQIADTISSLNYDVCYVLNANCSFCFATLFSILLMNWKTMQQIIKQQQYSTKVLLATWSITRNKWH